MPTWTDPAVEGPHGGPEGFRDGKLEAVRLDPRAAVAHRGLEDAHRGRPDEEGHEEVRRPVVHLEGRADLLESAVLHDGDPRAHRHGLDLVVGDVDRRRLQPALQALDLGPHLEPQLRVEVRERLVEEVDGGLAHDRASQRDALALASRELARAAVEERRELEGRRRLGDQAVDLFARDLPHLQAELEVLADGHVGVESVVLEDHGDVAVLRREVVDAAAADGDRSSGEVFEACDHPERRRLPAARGADEDHEFLVADLEIQVRDHGRAVVALVDVLEPDLRHGGVLHGAGREVNADAARAAVFIGTWQNRRRPLHEPHFRFASQGRFPRASCGERRPRPTRSRARRSPTAPARPSGIASPTRRASSTAARPGTWPATTTAASARTWRS